MDDSDDGARIGVWVALGIVAVLVFSLVTGLAWRSAKAVKAAKAPTTALAAAASADVALSKALAMAAEQPAKKVVPAGFHDPSGDPAKNAELAKERAKAVREALKTQGLAADRILLRRPALSAADRPAEDARRVEIRLADLP